MIDYDGLVKWLHWYDGVEDPQPNFIAAATAIETIRAEVAKVRAGLEAQDKTMMALANKAMDLSAELATTKARLERLQSHVEKMQQAAANYIEPCTYTIRYPCASFYEFKTAIANSSSTHDKRAARGLERLRAKAFINDVIYMLDGPEQRAAQGIAKQEPSQ